LADDENVNALKKDPWQVTMLWHLQERTSVRKSLKRLSALAFPLFSIAALMTAVPSAHAATPALALYEYGSNVCLAGNAGSIYTSGGCSETPADLNHAALWYYPAQGYDSNDKVNEVWLENVHYLVCVTVTGDAGAYPQVCGSNHVQWWEIIGYNGSKTTFVVRNVHTGQYLCADVSGSDLSQNPNAGNPSCWWNVRYTSV
jgi:hypothetical protein